MAAADLMRALEGWGDELAIGLPFGERVRLAVDEAYTGFTDIKITVVIVRDGLRIPARTYARATWSRTVAWTARCSPNWPPARSSPTTT